MRHIRFNEELTRRLIDGELSMSAAVALDQHSGDEQYVNLVRQAYPAESANDSFRQKALRLTALGLRERADRAAILERLGKK